MDIQGVFILKLQIGDYITMMNENSEKIEAIYAGDLNETKRTFSFRIQSTKELKTAEIDKLHSLDVTLRASN